jgi:hypothetical protein
MSVRMRSSELIFVSTNGLPRRGVNLIQQFSHLKHGKPPFGRLSKRVLPLPRAPRSPMTERIQLAELAHTDLIECRRRGIEL